MPLKVILETDLLTSEEIKKACELCVAAGADFVKTSTGFVKMVLVQKQKMLSLWPLWLNLTGLA